MFIKPMPPNIVDQLSDNCEIFTQPVKFYRCFTKLKLIELFNE